MELLLIVVIGTAGVYLLLANPVTSTTVATSLPEILKPTTTDSIVLGWSLIVAAVFLIAIWLVIDGMTNKGSTLDQVEKFNKDRGASFLP